MPALVGGRNGSISQRTTLAPLSWSDIATGQASPEVERQDDTNIHLPHKWNREGLAIEHTEFERHDAIEARMGAVQEHNNSKMARAVNASGKVALAVKDAL